MAEIIICSGCQHKLQVPDQYLGQTVQCPECGHMFVATATSVSATPASAPAAPPPSSSKPSRFDDDDDYPTRRRPRFEDDDDDDYGDIDARRTRRHFAPHRGGLIMTLGLVSLIGGWMFCLPVVVGPFAWVMGTLDMREIRAGRMDPSGEGMVRTGQVCGIISTLIMIGALLVIGFVVLAEMRAF